MTLRQKKKVERTQRRGAAAHGGEGGVRRAQDVGPGAGAPNQAEGKTIQGQDEGREDSHACSGSRVAREEPQAKPDRQDRPPP
jgi:hypothetical protein